MSARDDLAEQLVSELRSQLAAATKRAEEAEAMVKGLHDLAESAWGVIANAGGGNWSRETNEWAEAAARWRDRYHAALGDAGEVGPSDHRCPKCGNDYTDSDLAEGGCSVCGEPMQRPRR